MTHPTPWHGTEAGYLTAIARAAARRPNAQPADWTPPTGDTWLLVRVGRDELTCLGCGETFPAGDYCQRCGARDGEDGPYKRREDLPPAVRTVDYLRDDEYRMVG